MTDRYKLSPEDEDQIQMWGEKWVDVAMRARPMDDDDREKARLAIRGLYRAAGTEPPPDERIIFVSSPFVGMFAASFALKIWKKPELARWKTCPDNEIWRAAYAAAKDAPIDRDMKTSHLIITELSSRLETVDDAKEELRFLVDRSSRIRIELCMYSIIEPIVCHALGEIYHAFMRAAEGCHDGWFSMTEDLAEVANNIGFFSWAKEAMSIMQDGNLFELNVAIYSFFQEIVGIDMDWTNFSYWRDAAMHSGPRWMHEKFCIVSDFPELLLVDDEYLPVRDNGPFCRWKNGDCVYARLTGQETQ